MMMTPSRVVGIASMEMEMKKKLEEAEDSRMYESCWRCAYLDMFAVRTLRK
jgi:hypothetical protein